MDGIDETIRADPRPEAGGVYPNTGTTLGGRYRLGEILGTGASGRVFKAEDLMLNRTVAVKVFTNASVDALAPARQHIEMTVLAGLDHPNLVTIYDAHIDGWAADLDPVAPTAGAHSSPVSSTYFVMEYVEGRTLSHLMAVAGATAAELSRLGAEIAAGLAAVHQRGLVHRDVKPANILITSAGRAKLSDFGVALMVDQATLTRSGEIVGTAAYLSPEQARGKKVGPPSDVYSLGLVLLEAITGRREFTGTVIEAAVARLLRDPVVPADLPEPWSAILPAMTHADPVMRPTAAQVQAILAGQKPPEPDLVSEATFTAAIELGAPGTLLDLSPISDQVPERNKRKSTLWIGAGLLAIAAITVALVLGMNSATEPGPKVPGAEQVSESSAPDSATIDVTQDQFAPSENAESAAKDPEAADPDEVEPTSPEPASVSAQQTAEVGSSAAVGSVPEIAPIPTAPSTAGPQDSATSAVGNGNNGNGNGNTGGNGNNNGNGNGNNGGNGNGNNGGNGNGNNGGNGNG